MLLFLLFQKNKQSINVNFGWTEAVILFTNTRNSIQEHYFDQYVRQLYAIVVRSEQFLRRLYRCLRQQSTANFMKISRQIQKLSLQELDLDRSVCMIAIRYSGAISAVPTNEQRPWKKRTCSKFQIDNSKTEELFRVYVYRQTDLIYIAIFDNQSFTRATNCWLTAMAHRATARLTAQTAAVQSPKWFVSIAATGHGQLTVCRCCQLVCSLLQWSVAAHECCRVQFGRDKK